MNNENLEHIPQPDPTWDYYITWHKLFKAKSHLEKLIKYVGQFEDAEPEVDEQVEADVILIIKYLEDVLPKIETE